MIISMGCLRLRSSIAALAHEIGGRPATSRHTGAGEPVAAQCHRLIRGSPGDCVARRSDRDGDLAVRVPGREVSHGLGDVG